MPWVPNRRVSGHPLRTGSSFVAIGLSGNMDKTVAGARFVGQRVARTEDARFLTGHGLFVDDVVLPGALHAVECRNTGCRNHT